MRRTIPLGPDFPVARFLEEKKNIYRSWFETSFQQRILRFFYCGNCLSQYNLHIKRHRNVIKPRVKESPFMQKLKIHCFGTLTITKNGEVITQFDTDKARALLVYLALEQKRSLTRSHLAGVLWSDLSEKQALQSLRQTLLILRKALGDFSPQQLIFSEKDVVRINPDIPIWVDVIAFKNELFDALQFFQRQDQFHQINFRRLKNAFKIKSGIFLDNFSITGAYLFDEWLSLTRESLDHQATEGLGYLVQYYQNRCEYGLARSSLQQILQITPWNERAHVMLMQLYAVDGQWSAFENQYRLLRKFLMNEIGVEPTSETTAFYEKSRKIRSEAPTLLNEPNYQSKIPLDGARFIGRERELDEVTSLLVDPACRLITLHGPGGIGKTSLALEIFRQQTGVYRDGVFFVSLGGVHTNEELITELIMNLQVPLLDSTNLDERLRDFLRNKTILLVLDNFEQLLADSETTITLGKIIRNSINIKILVTSRERLNLIEEWVYPINGLTYPVSSNLSETELVKQYDALALFQQRAKQVKPDFKLDQRSISAVVEICRLYEGLPLAIELAAADVWSQSCQWIAEKISCNLNSLHSNTSNVAPRYRNLWRNLDDSWNLMDENLRRIFTKIGIFEDSFSYSTAKTICLSEQDDLNRLVNQSLLQLYPDGRYKTHSVIQQYAFEKLKQSGMLQEVKLVFVHFFTEFLQIFFEKEDTIHQKQVLDEIQVELRNLKKAWQLIIEFKHIEHLEIFLEPFYQFYNIRSRFREGMELYQPALNLLSELQSNETDDQFEILQGKLLVKSGSLAHRARENSQARESLEKAKQIFSKHSLEKELIDCQTALAEVYLRSNEYANAGKTAEKNLEYYHQTCDKVGQIKALNTLGLVSLRRGEIEGARGYFNQSVELGRKSETKRHLIVPLNYLGDIACNEGNYQEATSLFQKSLKIASELEDLYQEALLLNNLASVYHVELDYLKASETYRRSLEICRQIVDLNGEAIALANLGEIALAQENCSEAISLSNQALDISREIGEEWSISICLNILAEAYCKLGQFEKAQQHIREALQIAYKNEAIRFLARYAITAGRCYQLQGSYELAKELLSAALAHSSTEYDIREKANEYCKEMGMDEVVEVDCEKLTDVVRRFFDLGK